VPQKINRLRFDFADRKVGKVFSKRARAKAFANTEKESGKGETAG
jgi:hypothetical protein